MSRHNVEWENAANVGLTQDDFGSEGIKADVISESTSATGCTIDGVLVKDNAVTATGTITGGTMACTNLYATSDIGFTSGGGAVTQATNKSTGVTLSKPCGTITTHNAELAAGVEVTFTVTNTRVSAPDVIVLAIQAGGTPGEYQATVSAVASGTFDITLANLSGSAASDAVWINFILFQSVTA